MPEEEVGPIKRGLGLLGLRTPKVITEISKNDRCPHCFGLDYIACNFVDVACALAMLLHLAGLCRPAHEMRGIIPLLFGKLSHSYFGCSFARARVVFLFPLPISDCQPLLLFCLSSFGRRSTCRSPATNRTARLGADKGARPRRQRKGCQSHTGRQFAR